MKIVPSAGLHQPFVMSTRTVSPARVVATEVKPLHASQRPRSTRRPQMAIRRFRASRRWQAGSSTIRSAAARRVAHSLVTRACAALVQKMSLEAAPPTLAIDLLRQHGSPSSDMDGLHRFGKSSPKPPGGRDEKSWSAFTSLAQRRIDRSCCHRRFDWHHCTPAPCDRARTCGRTCAGRAVRLARERRYREYKPCTAGFIRFRLEEGIARCAAATSACAGWRVAWPRLSSDVRSCLPRGTFVVSPDPSGQSATWASCQWCHPSSSSLPTAMTCGSRVRRARNGRPSLERLAAQAARCPRSEGLGHVEPRLTRGPLLCAKRVRRSRFEVGCRGRSQGSDRPLRRPCELNPAASR